MARKNGFALDGLVEVPAGIKESLMRDELWVERDLVISSASGSTLIFTTAKSSNDDFYNGSYIVNATKGERFVVTDYVGSTKTFTTSSAHGWDNDDKCYIKNINNNIDVNSFDVAQAQTVETGTASSTASYKLIESGQNFLTTVLPGMVVHNTTPGKDTYAFVETVDLNTQLTLQSDIMTSGDTYEITGTRNGWKFARCLTQQESIQDLLSKLCYESHSILNRSYKSWKITCLESGKIDGILSLPLSDEDSGRPKVAVSLSPVSNVYTDFTLNYGYDYAKKIYKNKLTVNKNVSSNVALDSFKAICQTAEESYKISREWVYNADWINDETTAINFIGKIVSWLTYQRTLVEYWGDIKNHIQYEEGDRVTINYSYMMPTGINNSMVFLIYGSKIYPKKKVVQLKLIY